jgi:lipopolysaccharide/colanic/teichoic acid biosynthesis glycosyltransferase/glycosyltransferase involved in cell wall biosynthesis
MKILVLSSLAYSLTNFRGTLLTAMVDAGHKVVACAPDENDEVRGWLAKKGIGFRTVRMARAGMNPFADAVTLWDMVSLMRKERPDVVLAYTQKPIIYGGLAARIVGGIRYFAMCSGLGHAFSGEGGFRSQTLKKIVSLLYRGAVAKAAGVFVFNKDDNDEMRQNGILKPGEAAVQVPGSGIDLSRFVHRPLPPGPPKFLMIARLLRDKGPAEFAAAAAQVRERFPDARFQLLGPFDANPSSVSKDELDRWQADGSIEYLGETSDVQPFLADCSVFVLPTYYREGLPRTILEAMATGRAIITTETPGCRETVTKDTNGILVPPRESVALAEAMAQLAGDAQLRIRYGNASRRIAEDRFDVHKVNALLLGSMGLDRASSEKLAAHGDSSLLASYTSSQVPTPHSGLRRAVDFLVAALSLTLLWPLLAITALAVAAFLGRPVLFRQQRVGLAGRLFTLVKFRTMTDARDANGQLLPDSERLTKFGHFLRRFRIDELPELWNVLRGEMSLFGPRPLLPQTIHDFGIDGLTRCSIRPGLTGWAQIRGGPLLGQQEKLALDNWYVTNRSWKTDMVILMRTFSVIVRDDRLDDLETGGTHAGFGRRRG